MPETMRLSALLLDESLYPRSTISAGNIASLMEAIRADVPLPPLVVDRKTLTVVDGHHRARAYRRLRGPDCEVAVTLKDYRDRSAMLADAVALNVGRGADLTRWDIMRSMDLADEVGLPLDSLAKLLRWRPERLAAYREGRMGRTLDDRKLALKRSIRHRLDQPLSPEQEEANKTLSGMSPMFHVNQLLTLLEADLMPDDEHLVERLEHLAQAITAWAEAHQPPSEGENYGSS